MDNNAEQFINMVQNHPLLYDKSHKDYKKAEMKMMVFRQIGG